MENNKCTLIVDGNWLLMSRMFAFKEHFEVSNDAQRKTEGRMLLQEMMAKSINITINKFSDIVDNVVIVRDAGSWRKKVKKPAGYEEAYKGNRVKDSDLDWSYIFGALDDLMEAAASNNITVSSAYNVEGDDWAWHWSRKLNSEGVNCIIWSIDADLKQLVSYDNGVFTAWYEHKPGLVLHKKMQMSINEISVIDMFMNYQSNCMVINPLVKSLQLRCSKVTYIDPADIIESKIICGDAGDNIKPVVQWQSDGKSHKITEKQWAKCREDAGVDSLGTFFAKYNEIARLIASSKKLPSHLTKEHVMEMLEYNKQLVWLDRSVYPEKILEKMEECEYKTGGAEYIKHNYKTLIKGAQDEDAIKAFDDAMADDLPF